MKGKIIFIAIIVALLGGAFYWFQWRPIQIKHDCSWVEWHKDAIPAQGGKTEEEYRKCMAETKKTGWEKLNYCVEGGIASPARPAEDGWREASKGEYDFCIHEKGL